MMRGAEPLDFSVGKEYSCRSRRVTGSHPTRRGDFRRRRVRRGDDGGEWTISPRARAAPRTRVGLIANRMASRRWWRVVVAIAALLACVTGAEASIQVELRFDSRALDPQAKPDFTCYSYGLSRWVGCRIQKSDAPGAYSLETLEPGKYQMHVSVDENPANPRRFPGDYEAQVSFEVTATGPERLVVDL